jgi:hypothetical protein
MNLARGIEISDGGSGGGGGCVCVGRGLKVAEEQLVVREGNY